MLLLGLMTGCSTAPDKPSASSSKPTFKQIAQCGSDDQVATRSATHLNVTQKRGEPNQFVLCDDCPCPTRKSAPISKPATPEPVAKKWVIHFDHGDAALNNEHKHSLDQLIATLPQHYRLVITGHTDDAAPGGTVSNQTVADQRASNVADYLARHDVPRESMTVQAKPLCCYIAPNTHESGRALNRRTEIVLIHLPTRGVEP